MKDASKIPSKKAFYDWCEESSWKDYEIRKALSEADLYNHPLEKDGSYPYIPFSADAALYDLFEKISKMRASETTVIERDKISLLDVGCGTGRIVWLAKKFGLSAKGLEYHEPYVKLGKEYFGLSDEDLMVGNAFDLKYDFLKQFRVIYTYMPLYKPVEMTRLHFSMYYEAARHTIFVEMLPSYYPMSELRHRNFRPLGWEDVYYSVAEKRHG